MLLLSRIIFCSLLALFPLAAVIHGNYTHRVEGLLECVVFILACLSIVGGWFSGGRRATARCLSYPVLGIAILALVQTLPSLNVIKRWSLGIISADPFETRLFALKLLALIVFGELLIQHVCSKRRLQLLIFVLLLVGVASCAFGLGRHLIDNTLSLGAVVSEPSFGQFSNRNHFAFLMEMTFGLILGLITMGWRQGKLLITVAAAGLVCTAVILTHSRGGILSMSMQMGFFLLAGPIMARGTLNDESIVRLPGQPKRRFNPIVRRAALMACLLVAITTGALMVGGAGIAQRFSSVAEELKPQDLAHRHHTRRREIWSATIHLIGANPIAGIGFGAYGAAIPQYHDATGEFQLQEAHNDYLELLASGGLVGGCLGAWFMVAIFLRARKCLQSITDPFRRAVWLGSLTGLIAVAVHSVVDFGLHIFVNALVFTALTVLASTSVGDKEKREPSPGLRRVLNPPLRKAVSYSVAGAFLVMFASAAWATGTTSISRLLSYEGASSKRLSSSQASIRLSEGDPEAHASCGLVLLNQGQAREAAAAYERAVALRPRDYDLWLQLGRAYRQSGELNKAAESLRRSIHYAPYYAEPHWEMGTLLLSSGRRDDAFKEFRMAVQSNPELLKAQIALAWKEYGGDAMSIIEAVQPRRDLARLALAQFFAENERPAACLKVFRSVAYVSEHHRSALVRELMRDKRFLEAHEVWSGEHREKNNDRQPTSYEINNGSFENEIAETHQGFEWLFAQNLSSVAVSLDVDEQLSGKHSLRLDFSGNSTPTSRLVSQFVLVKPGTQYTLNFATRTKDITTAGLPLVMVLDASVDGGRVLAQSTPLASGTHGWQKIAVEFKATKNTSAVLILIRRRQCETVLCPVFGTAWFDDFSLQAHPAFDGSEKSKVVSHL